MALWTPYQTEEALDLSKVKQEKPSPPPYDYPYNISVPPTHLPYAVSPTLYPVYQSAPSPPDSVDFDTEYNLSDDLEYQTFERDALRAMAERNGGSLLGNNPRMRRAVQSNQAADDLYRKQRERNNSAAKQSRDRRKLRELRLSLQATYLRKKIADLKAKLMSGVCSRCRHSCLC